MFYKASLRQEIGQNSENIAYEYLQGQGLTLITRNFSCKMGEIDLILREGNTIVFVEVRSRTKSDSYGAIESVTYPKQGRLLRTGLFYLQKKGWLETHPCRFDVIGITYSNGQPMIRWVKQAFSL